MWVFSLCAFFNCQIYTMKWVKMGLFWNFLSPCSFYRIYVIKLIINMWRFLSLLSQIYFSLLRIVKYTGQHIKESDQLLPALFLYALMWTFLTSVSPQTVKFLQKVVLKVEKSSYWAYFIFEYHYYKAIRDFKCMTGLWREMWMKQRLHMQRSSIHACFCEKVLA